MDVEDAGSGSFPKCNRKTIKQNNQEPKGFDAGRKFWKDMEWLEMANLQDIVE